VGGSNGEGGAIGGKPGGAGIFVIDPGGDVGLSGGGVATLRLSES